MLFNLCFCDLDNVILKFTYFLWKNGRNVRVVTVGCWHCNSHGTDMACLHPEKSRKAGAYALL